LRLELNLKPLERRVDQRMRSDPEIWSGVSTKISNSATPSPVVLNWSNWPKFAATARTGSVARFSAAG
jgi:hypothetical protein